MKKILVLLLVLSLLTGCNAKEEIGNVQNEGNGTNELETNEVSVVATNLESSESGVDEASLVEEEVGIKSTVTYPSKDGLIITSDIYRIDESSDFIVLFHRADWSRGEYIETALRFNELGYNVMAVDQRSGLKINKIDNETAIRALAEGYPTSWEDAGMDVAASIEFVRDDLGCDSMYILGSSYSSVLVLVVGQEYTDVIKGVIAFSPGELFSWKDGKIKDSIVDLTVPVFVTSKKTEIPFVESLFEHIPSENKVHFKPESYGRHGAESLWSNVKNNAEYWDALIAFLEDTKALN